MLDLREYWEQNLSEDAYEDAVGKKTWEIHRSYCDRYLRDDYEPAFGEDDFGMYYRGLDDEEREDLDRHQALRVVGETYEDFLEIKLGDYYRCVEYNPRDVEYGDIPIPGLLGVYLGWDNGSIGSYEVEQLWKEGLETRYDFSYALGFDIDFELFWNPAIYMLVIAIEILHENGYPDSAIWDFFDYYSQRVSPMEDARSYFEAYLSGVPLEDIFA